ncbi:MAG: peptide chain release factor N(5)-glutamine methyltransferase [Parvularculaceae bacterium]|nr:peptide chain release factor N(5)-glutamine methyltransferase [Parvularculaceae bacterium]
MTLAAALRWGAGELRRSPTAALDARVLLKALLNLNDTALIVEDSRILSADECSAFEGMIARRANDEPVAYITGIREFWSLPIAVEPGILVPRPDSETLITAVLKRRDTLKAHRVLDLGCGSGALLCAALSKMPKSTGTGVDISECAVTLTNRNLSRLGFTSRGAAIVGDWTAPLEGQFDIILSNPPYIADRERGRLPREVEAYEDPRALFAGPEGLSAYEQLSILLPEIVAPGALIVLELGAGQAAAAARLFLAAFSGARIETERDLSGVERALIVDLPTGPR